MTKRLVIFGAAVMTAVLALAVVWQFRIAVIYVLISLALAATVRPLIKDWSKLNFAMRLGYIALYLIVLCGFGLLLFHVGKFAIDDMQQLTQMLSTQNEWKVPAWLEGSSFQKALVMRLPPPSRLFEAVTGTAGQGHISLSAVLGFTEGVGGVVGGLLAIMFLSIYWSIGQVHIERLWLSLLPSARRKRARRIWRTIEPNLGAYIRSEVIQSLLAALLLFFGYWYLGSPYPTLMALVGAIVWLVPVVGAALAVILPVSIGLLTSVHLALFTAVYTLVVLIALQVWLEPRLYKQRWDNPILTLVILLAMADAFGLLGILVAPPLSAVCQILWSFLISNRRVSCAAAQVSDLKERQARLWVAIKEMDEEPPPLVASSMERLAALIEKAEPILPAARPVEPSDASDLLHP